MCHTTIHMHFLDEQTFEVVIILENVSQARMHSLAMKQHNMAFVRSKIYFICAFTSFLTIRINLCAGFIAVVTVAYCMCICAYCMCIYKCTEPSPQSDVKQPPNLFQHAVHFSTVLSTPHLANTSWIAQSHEHKY